MARIFLSVDLLFVRRNNAEVAHADGARAWAAGRARDCDAKGDSVSIERYLLGALLEFERALVSEGVYNAGDPSLGRAVRGAREFVHFLLQGPIGLGARPPRLLSLLTEGLKSGERALPR